ncbi:MAG: sugar ABC transporter permease [Treponema sp.]|nr:sugar ABC transporter permease [Treponema sp.]
MNKILTRPGADRFIGLDNFIRLFTKEPLFLKSLWNGFVFTFFSVVFEYLFGLIIALVLNSKFAKLKNASKALLMLPWAVPIAINSMMWRFLLAPNFGFLSQALTAVGIPGMLQANWLGDLKTAMPVVIFINVWRSFPFYTITLVAGLSIIPQELYEAAEVDGASGWHRFWKVTLPGIKNTSAVIIIFHIIWTFSNFDVIYLLTGGGPLNSTEVLPTLLYRQAFSNFNMGYASAMGIFVFIILMIVAGPLYNRFVMRED